MREDIRRIVATFSPSEWEMWVEQGGEVPHELMPACQKALAFMAWKRNGELYVKLPERGAGRDTNSEKQKGNPRESLPAPAA